MTTSCAGTAATFVTGRRIRAWRREAQPPPTTVTCFVIESCWPAPTTNAPSARARRRVAVAVRQEVRQLDAVDNGLVADHGARRRAGVDARSNWSTPRPGRSAGRTGSGGVRFGRADVDARSERRDPAIRLADRQLSSRVEFRDVRRVGRNRVGEHAPVAGIAAEFWTVIV
jgi:hypothetical protein